MCFLLSFVCVLVSLEVWCRQTVFGKLIHIPRPFPIPLLICILGRKQKKSVHYNVPAAIQDKKTKQSFHQNSMMKNVPHCQSQRRWGRWSSETSRVLLHAGVKLEVGNGHEDEMQMLSILVCRVDAVIHYACHYIDTCSFLSQGTHGWSYTLRVLLI